MQPIGAGGGVISPNAYLARGPMGWYQGLSTGNSAVYWIAESLGVYGE